MYSKTEWILRWRKIFQSTQEVRHCTGVSILIRAGVHALSHRHNLFTEHTAIAKVKTRWRQGEEGKRHDGKFPSDLQTSESVTVTGDNARYKRINIRDAQRRRRPQSGGLLIFVFRWENDIPLLQFWQAS